MFEWPNYLKVSMTTGKRPCERANFTKLPLRSNRNSLGLVILPAVGELHDARAFVVGDVLRHFELAAVLQARADAGGAEGLVSDPGPDGGGRARR